MFFDDRLLHYYEHRDVDSNNLIIVMLFLFKILLVVRRNKSGGVQFAGADEDSNIKQSVYLPHAKT